MTCTGDCTRSDVTLHSLERLAVRVSETDADVIAWAVTRIVSLTERAEKAEREREEARQNDRLSRKMLAKQCDMAREAEIRRPEAWREREQAWQMIDCPEYGTVACNCATCTARNQSSAARKAFGPKGA